MPCSCNKTSLILLVRWDVFCELCEHTLMSKLKQYYHKLNKSASVKKFFQSVFGFMYIQSHHEVDGQERLVGWRKIPELLTNQDCGVQK